MNAKEYILPLAICLAATLVSQAQLPTVAYGTLVRHQVSSTLVDQRYVDVWLPPDYERSRQYPVVYMHDGQMLFDSTLTWNKQEWGVDETLGQLISTGKIPPCIVVGVWNNGEKRHAEYFPQKVIAFIPQAARDTLMPMLKGGPRADAYLRFLVTEVKPLIDRLYSTKAGKDNTFISGSSMGGLISWYALCEYPDTFGAAACLSTHWPGIFTMDNNPIPEAMLAYLEKHLPPPAKHRLYFDYGTATLDSLYKPTQLRVDALMKAHGYGARNWQTREFPGAPHTEAAWRERLHIPFTFLLGGK